MTYKFPPENDDRNDPELDDGAENDDLVSKVYGPSQDDMDRSWEGYETGGEQGRSRPGNPIWKYIVIGVSLFVLASMAAGIVGPLVGRSRTVEPVQRTQIVRVSASVLRVIDSRTIVVRSGEGEQTVRLIGIQSPIFGDTLYDVARQVSQNWIEGKEVLLEADEREVDGQGRLLRYVYLDNVMINAALILNGLGRVETENPNTRYDSYLAGMEQRARESGVGMWDPAFAGHESGLNNTEA